MFDRHLLPLQKRLLEPPAARLAQAGISADTVTILGFVVGLAVVPLLAYGQYTAALAVILANRALDGLDGALARRTRPTDRGAFLDIALDFVFYALVPFGFALADPATNALPAATLLLAFVGTGSSFLAFAAVAARRGMSSAAYPGKGFHYLGGLTEGAETIAVFMAMCLWPSAFEIIAYAFAALCGLTTLTRWWWGWRAFAADTPRGTGDRPTSSTASKTRKGKATGVELAS
ncbi:MAG: CDP-alcohol phosphatidyltransferase family protein [Mesorhizobium sp.]|nr:CDP-alcohol phosphatidyltransferase family protein [Mesorhizobium sp.]MBL8580465.1 CDP-alcohol phosphatidyltransferase family protein [Mesorhizobium sp.]